MSIIEKLIEDLIIIPLSQTEWEFGLNEEYKKHAETIEQQRNELLEALIDDIQSYEFSPGGLFGIFCYKRNIKIIEKACYPKKWKEIKQIVDKER